MERKFKILLVEDDRTNLDLLAGIIPRKFPGVELFTAANGVEGLEAFKVHRPDIVLTDINMPDMNGVLMTGKIREIDLEARFIFLTGDSGNMALKDAAEQGFEIYHFIQKPVSFAELFAAIEQCLAEKKMPSEEVSGE